VLVVATTEEEVERARARLGELGARVVEVAEPSSVRRIVLATVVDPCDEEPIAVALRAECWAAVTRPDGGPRLAAWRRDTRPVTFDPRLTVCFAWSEDARAEASALVELGHGGWGSGQHPTTRMLVDSLRRRLSGGERVLDVGCGSGVLGLCAVRLGASQVVAVDVHAEAVESTRRNAALNGLAERVEATCEPLSSLDGTFDVVLANIGRAGVVTLAPELVAHLAPCGWLGVSGISPRQCDLVAGYLRPLVLREQQTDGEWAATTFTAAR
jgi:ribosomal protein L11 methyltransferase